MRRAQRRLTRFEFLQYGLWVTADLWLLYGGRWADYGYAAAPAAQRALLRRLRSLRRTIRNVTQSSAQPGLTS